MIYNRYNKIVLYSIMIKWIGKSKTQSLDKIMLNKKEVQAYSNLKICIGFIISSIFLGWTDLKKDILFNPIFKK